jgi:transcriptional regulator with XRE-family HTH domain
MVMRILKLRPDVNYFTGVELVEARERFGLTQEQFAELCGWTQQYQSDLENTPRHDLMPDHILRILSVLQTLKLS